MRLSPSPTPLAWPPEAVVIPGPAPHCHIRTRPPVIDPTVSECDSPKPTYSAWLLYGNLARGQVTSLDMNRTRTWQLNWLHRDRPMCLCLGDTRRGTSGTGCRARTVGRRSVGAAARGRPRALESRGWTALLPITGSSSPGCSSALGRLDGHTPDSTTQQKRVVSPLWRLEARNQGECRAAFLGEDPPCLPQSRGPRHPPSCPHLWSQDPSPVCLPAPSFL